VVELRHDTIVRGVLADADEDMNLTMEGVTYEPLQVCGWSYVASQPAQVFVRRHFCAQTARCKCRSARAGCMLLMPQLGGKRDMMFTPLAPTDLRAP